MAHIPLAGGKRLRPVMAQLTCEMVGGDGDCSRSGLQDYRHDHVRAYRWAQELGAPSTAGSRFAREDGWVH